MTRVIAASTFSGKLAAPASPSSTSICSFLPIHCHSFPFPVTWCSVVHASSSIYCLWVHRELLASRSHIWMISVITKSTFSGALTAPTSPSSLTSICSFPPVPCHMVSCRAREVFDVLLALQWLFLASLALDRCSAANRGGSRCPSALS
jgi:hypothetical protein